jgi:VanZ family protein
LPTSRHDLLKKWIAAILWIGVICIESTDLMSSNNTGSFIYSLLVPVFGHIDPMWFGEFHAVLRKVGHFVGYGILSFLLFRAWRATLKADRPTRWTWVWALVSFLMTALVASLDEWHQTFLPSRTGTYKDVLLDSAAALCVQVALFVLLSNRATPTPLASEHPRQL